MNMVKFNPLLISRTLTSLLIFLVSVFPSCNYSGNDVNQTELIKTANEIPFVDVLDSANIIQSQHEDIVKNSLLLGNGDINGMLFSEGSDMVIHLSKNDVWDARLDTKDDPPLMKIDLVNQKSTYKAKHYSTPSSWNNPYPCPQMCAKLVINNSASFTSVLDIRRAVARINNSQITVRALAQHNAFLIHSKDTIKLKSLKASYLPEPQTGITNNVEWITQELPPDLDWKGMSFAIALARMGNRTAIAIISSFDSLNPILDAISLAKTILEEKDKEVISRHEHVWQKFWAASAIKLEDKDLTNIWYRNLYFMRCFSKPGVQAVGLYAGMANDEALWHGSYTLDYNVEQTFWGTYCVNHAELSEPYERLMLDFLPRAKWFARETYDCDGAFYPVNIFGHEPDPKDCKSVNKRMLAYVPWTYVPGLSGYVCKNIWLHYKYDPDINYLKNIAYPVLSEAALFYCDFMDKCKRDDLGKVQFGPSFSPEHGDFGIYNCPFDLAFVRFTFDATLEAAKTLNKDPQLVSRVNTNIALIPDYPISEGNEPEIVDWPDDKPGREHNISVTSVPVFPAEVCTWFSEPEEKEIFKRTLREMKWNGNNAMIMLGVARARLSLDGTWKWLKDELMARLQPNGILSLNEGDHRFNTFGIYTENFSSSGAITELLLQSVDDIIRVFPAWPKKMDGRFKDLRAQGGFLVSAMQSGSEIVSIEITSTVGGQLRLVSPWEKLHLEIKNKGGSEIIESNAKGIVSFETNIGEKYMLTSSN